jgi:hypothetical protein
MNQSAYFDLQDVLQNELIGDIWLMVFVGVLVIWFVCLKAKTPFNIPITFSLIWFAVCFSIAYSELLILWAMVVLGVGFMFYYGISRLMAR